MSAFVAELISFLIAVLHVPHEPQYRVHQGTCLVDDLVVYSF